MQAATYSSGVRWDKPYTWHQRTNKVIVLQLIKSAAKQM